MQSAADLDPLCNLCRSQLGRWSLSSTSATGGGTKLHRELLHPFQAILDLPCCRQLLGHERNDCGGSGLRALAPECKATVSTSPFSGLFSQP